MVGRLAAQDNCTGVRTSQQLMLLESKHVSVAQKFTAAALTGIEHGFLQSTTEVFRCDVVVASLLQEFE